MKKIIYLFTGLSLMALGMSFDGPEKTHAIKYRSGAPEGHTGSPGDGQNCRACHASPAAQVRTGWITSNIPGTGYIPGETYTVTVTCNGPGHSRFGFQVSPQNSSGTLKGTMIKTDNNTLLSANKKYLTHTNSGSTGTDFKSWSFDWTAPAVGGGDVTFYGAFNLANNDGNTSGDTILLSTLAVKEGSGNAVAGIKSRSGFMQITPNPASRTAVIEWSDLPAGEVEITLFDIQGKKVGNIYKGLSTEGSSQKFDVFSYPRGVYFVVATSNGQYYSMEKLVIQN